METLQTFLSSLSCHIAPSQDPTEAEAMWREILEERDSDSPLSREQREGLLQVFLDAGVAEEDSPVPAGKTGMDFIAHRMEHGEDLPPNIRTWAEQNYSLLLEGAAGESELLHARQALSLLLRVDWTRQEFQPVDVVSARKILDAELYGLQGVKQRLLETLIQVNRTHTVPAYGILLVGPAGVGKSQLAHVMAQLLHRNWASLDMSMISTIEALTGTPRLYSNARPGAIMQAVCEAGSPQVMFLLNELDKAKNAQNGDPSMALLSLLDHLGFTDNYFECTIPTEGLYTMATANDVSQVDPSVLSRFTTIEIPDYTPEEKAVIFQDYVLPKVRNKLRMTPEECVVEDSAVERIIEQYAHRTGIRELEQEAEHLASHALYEIETKGLIGLRYSAEDVEALVP